MTIPLQYLVQPCSSTKGKISLGLCGRFTLAELLSVTVSIGVSGLIFKIIVASLNWMMMMVTIQQMDNSLSSSGCLCVGADRPLGPDGLHGNGALCRLHCFRQVFIHHLIIIHHHECNHPGLCNNLPLLIAKSKSFLSWSLLILCDNLSWSLLWSSGCQV